MVMMRVALYLLLGVTTSIAFPRQKQSRIIGGSLTTIERRPYVAALLAAFDGWFFMQSCGGTILNNRSILTAAHCFWLLNRPGQWRTRVGSSWAHSGGTVLESSQIISHPHYDSWLYDNDFAVLHVAGNINWVDGAVHRGRIAGVHYHLLDLEPVWVVGWGVDDSGNSSEQLRHAQLFSVNQNLCTQRYAERWAVIMRMVCAGLLDIGGRDACDGDSGSPLLHADVTVGVRSWGIGCGLARFPGVYARVSTAAEWIVANA